jgi:CO/xanthine dehydrogenase Mo-binding subunit
VNPLTARNQIQGAVVMGIGMALFELTTYDPQNGAPINSNFADYLVTTNADAPPIDVHFLDFPDKEMGECFIGINDSMLGTHLGARNLGRRLTIQAMGYRLRKW